MAKGYTYQQVKEYVEKEGYELLSKTYASCFDYLMYKCPEGHTCKLQFYSFKRGRRCQECHKRKRMTYSEVVEAFNKKGYVVASKKYLSTVSNLEVICPNGHSYTTTYSRFSRGSYCPECKRLNKSLSQGEAESRFAKYGYKLMEPYTNAMTPVNVLCPHGHLWKIDITNFYKNHARCKYCNELERERKRDIRKEQVAEYYLTHGLQETVDACECATNTVCSFFKEVYGCTKSEYLESIKS